MGVRDPALLKEMEEYVKTPPAAAEEVT